jgi:Lanthionine synthetase C-like protein
VGRASQLSHGAHAARLARGAADWLAEGVVSDPADLSLYHGLAGVILALHEAHQHFGDEHYGDAVARGADALSARVDGLEDSSLYFGLTGVAVALRALGRDTAADRALNRVRHCFDGQRWNRMFELLMGNAGIGLGALHAGDLDLAVTAVTRT